MRWIGATVSGVVLAFLGLLTWELIALTVAFAALAVASIALVRSGRRDAEVAAWKAAASARTATRAEALARALHDDLTED